MTTPYEFDERMAAAKARLFTAFDPQTDAERSWLDWLAWLLTPAEIDDWSTMVERRVADAIATAAGATDDALTEVYRRKLALLAAVEQLAYDRGLAADDAMRRIRYELRFGEGENV